MAKTSEQFITSMKFRELRVQRDKSQVAYEALSSALRATPDDASRLRLLYDGLRDLRFAKQPLHPDVANLEPLLRDLDRRATSAETLEFWRAELERELARGQLRSEIVYVFGALLEEWATQAPEQADQSATQREAHAALLDGLTHPPQETDRVAFLQSVFEDLRLPPQEDLRTAAGKAADELVYAGLNYTPRGNAELEAILDRIKDDVYRSGAIRAQAQRFRLNPTLVKELSDVLAILIDHLDEWDWPEAGVSARTLWARSKWRLFLDEDLQTACLLELLGSRWRQAIERVLGGKATDRIRRLQRLHDLGAPAIILENEQSMLMAGIAPEMAGADIWADAEENAPAPDTKAQGAAFAEMWGEPGSIALRRASAQGDLRSFDRFDAYGEVDVKGGIETALRLVHAEVALGRGAFPERPLYVIKMDLRDYYPSLPHDVILTLLARLGLAERDLAYFERYLRLRISDGTHRVEARVGIPNRRGLSDLLGETVLLLLDTFVRHRAKVQIIRLLDDICLLAASPEEAMKAWDAVRAFCAGCGLVVNDEKCGAVCIGGELPEGLPSARPGWQLLALDEHGEWTVDEAAFARFLDQTRRELAATSSIIAQVRVYNAGLAYLEHACGFNLPLGATHRRSVEDAVRRFHGMLFGDDRGIAGAVQRTIRERFLGAAAAARLPEAWLYWPITAGGLGLRQAVLRAATYAQSFERRTRLEPPTHRSADWQRRDNEWARYYAALLEDVKPIEPAPNKVMETLVKDFISRGADLSAGKQKTLSTYWRWILYIYGPQIQESFGTFRFLFSELVPLQLLTERHLQNDEADEET